MDRQERREGGKEGGGKERRRDGEDSFLQACVCSLECRFGGDARPREWGHPAGRGLLGSKIPYRFVLFPKKDLEHSDHFRRLRAQGEKGWETRGLPGSSSCDERGHRLRRKVPPSTRSRRRPRQCDLPRAVDPDRPCVAPTLRTPRLLVTTLGF